MTNFKAKTNAKFIQVLNDDTGEVGSWLIVAAGLAAAAVAAVATLDGVIQRLAEAVGTAAGV